MFLFLCEVCCLHFQNARGHMKFFTSKCGIWRSVISRTTFYIGVHRRTRVNWCYKQWNRNSEFTQQDGRKKRTAERLCLTNVTRLLLACFVVIFAYINVFWSFTKRSVYWGGWSLAKSFKQNYCHHCHTRFAVSFPLPSCCVSSLLTDTQPTIKAIHRT